jgi:hypothetical protein
VSGTNLKPWNLGSVFPALFVILFGTIAVFMIISAPSLKVTFISKVLVVLLAVAGVAAAVSTFMWSRYWRHVQWDDSFWAFVSGPIPEYEEAQLAWRWGRRFRLSWAVLMVTTFSIPLVEILAKRWR